jgi:type I restriction enzyme S subunit
LVCSNSGDIKKRGDSRLGLVANSNDIYQGVRSGDLLIHGMDTWHGAIAVSKFDGMCTPVVHVCDSSQNKEYVATYLRNMASQQIFKLISNGVRQNTSDFRSWDKLSRIPIPLPPLVEQEKIVSYLEDKTSKIDEVILAKEKQIKLLQELKDAEIANVITRGLNPDVKMKRYDSLLSSECPEHWCITRNKSFMSLVGEKVGRQSVSYTLLSLTTKGVIIRDVESGKGKFPKDFDTYQIVQRGELVFCLFDIDETPRTVGIVETGGMVTGAYTVLRVNEKYAIPEYVYYYYLCVDNIKALKPYYSGLRKTVRADKFLQLYIPVPSVEEQRTIIAYIEDKNNKIEALVKNLEAEIAYLKEYKQKLVADCVIGQINVQCEQ